MGIKSRTYDELVCLMDLLSLNFISAKLRDNSIFFKLNNKSKTVSFFLRIGSSDAMVARQVLIEENYFPNIFTTTKKKVFVDLGANIGLASIMCFSNTIDEVFFILVEASEENYKFMNKNIVLNELGNSHCFNGAIWTAPGFIYFHNSDSKFEEWSGFCDNNNSGIPVKTILLNDLLDQFSYSDHEVFIKMDIEGSERYFYDDPSFWAILVEKVAGVSIEIHPISIADIWIKKFSEHGFLYIGNSGEMLIFRRND